MRKCLLFVLLTSCVPISQTSYDPSSSKALALTDKVYEEQIKTVRLFAANGDPLQEIGPPITPFGHWNLLLEYDDLTSSRDSYYARIIHCNADWVKSSLSDLDFLPEYNEFPITTFEFSVDTHIPYVRYSFRLPPVKLPGNYVVVVYRGSNRDDIVLSKRFMIYQQRVTFFREDNLIGSVGIALRNQQLNFTISHKNIEALNPMDNFNVTVRQNFRWDTMKEGIKPSFIRDNERELEYRFFDDSKMFFGGNEFRFFDLRSLNNPGQNVDSVDRSVKPYTVYLQPDSDRSQGVYAQYSDINGGFIHQNYDYQDDSFSNYVNVTFRLRSPQPINGDVFVVGAFDQWNANADSKMKYDSTNRSYAQTMLLKQGYYNYQYLVKSPTLPFNHFEGNYFQTENVYEVLVYFRSYQPMADLLVGYYQEVENKR